jgi:hypothetical protein
MQWRNAMKMKIYQCRKISIMKSNTLLPSESQPWRKAVTGAESYRPEKAKYQRGEKRRKLMAS